MRNRGPDKMKTKLMLLLPILPEAVRAQFIPRITQLATDPRSYRKASILRLKVPCAMMTPDLCWNPSTKVPCVNNQCRG